MNLNVKLECLKDTVNVYFKNELTISRLKQDQDTLIEQSF